MEIYSEDLCTKLYIKFNVLFCASWKNTENNFKTRQTLFYWYVILKSFVNLHFSFK